MTTTYINRYGDEIIFNQVSDKEIHVTGYNPAYLRQGREGFNTDKIIMVDPSGGPYMSVGTNLKNYFNDKTDRIISEININENKIIFIIK